MIKINLYLNNNIDEKVGVVFSPVIPPCRTLLKTQFGKFEVCEISTIYFNKNDVVNDVDILVYKK